MALDSPSDRIGQMLRLIAVDLGNWISALDVWPSDVSAARRADPQQQFRVLLDEWHRTFRDHLTQADKTYVFELKDVRNRWAHHGNFSADDVWRALDTGERLMRAIGADETADGLGRAKRSDTPGSAHKVGARVGRETERPQPRQPMDTRSSIEPAVDEVPDSSGASVDWIWLTNAAIEDFKQWRIRGGATSRSASSYASGARAFIRYCRRFDRDPRGGDDGFLAFLSASGELTSRACSDYQSHARAFVRFLTEHPH